MRCTDRREMPTAFAIMRPVQCVASPGGSLWVSSTTRSIVAAGRGGGPGLRGPSRGSPARPPRATRPRHRRTHGRETPARCPILTVPWPSAAARTILARQTCFCGLLRSATPALSRARSVLLTSRLIPLAMPHHIAAGQPTEHYDCVNPLDETRRHHNFRPLDVLPPELAHAKPSQVRQKPIQDLQEDWRFLRQ